MPHNRVTANDNKRPPLNKGGLQGGWRGRNPTRSLPHPLLVRGGNTIITLASIYGRGNSFDLPSQDQSDTHQQAKHQRIGRDMHVEIDQAVEQKSNDASKQTAADRGDLPVCMVGEH